MLKPFFKNIG